MATPSWPRRRWSLKATLAYDSLGGVDIGEAGVKDLQFVLDAMPGERNTINNAQYRTIDVPEDRRRILYVEGEPRWEYKFIRRALERISPIRLASLLRTTPNKFTARV
ncbi:MAG: hypothetical protein CM1200mP36_11650 [Gammaproteobacteria bacterium]|nr:MAG: hypothetical protein CM1200mP36_11650 [Gammaproteobacteria bacterium]